MSVRESAPPAPVSPSPVLAGFPAAIARAGLGAVDSAGESTTVTFAAPDGTPEYVPFSTAPVTVSREAVDEAPAPAPEATPPPDSAQPATAPLPGAKGGGAGAADKQFEELYDRLKRELLIEQEQLGQLFHEP